MEVIDAYLHCGLSKFEPIETVRDVMARAGAARGVLVQHLGEYDNSYISGIAAAEPARYAAVGLLDHARPDAIEALSEMKEAGVLKGIRLTAQWLEDAPDLWRRAVDLGFILVLFAPEGIIQNLQTLANFLADRPRARIVLTHLGNPATAASPSFENHQSLFALAKREGLIYQLSGMDMCCPYPHEPLYPLIAEAVQSFGPARLMWGSNYPVVGDTENYARDLDLVKDGRLPIPQDAIAQVIGGTARELWFPESVIRKT